MVCDLSCDAVWYVVVCFVVLCVCVRFPNVSECVVCDLHFFFVLVCVLCWCVRLMC